MKIEKVETTEIESIDTEKKSSEVSSENMNNLIQDTTKQLEDIKTSLQDKATEVEELHSIALEQEKKFQDELAKVQQELESKESLIKELQEALENATKAKEDAVEELNKMKEEALLSNRLQKLQDLKLLRSGEEAQIKQAEKVKSMSEECFAEYIEDLLDIRVQSEASTVKPADAAEEDTSKVDTKLEEELTSAAAGEQAKAKLRELLGTLKKDNTEESKGSEEVQPDEQKEVASEKQTSFPDVALLQRAFLGILEL